MYLDRDFLVASGGTLIIDPGTVVVVAATDSANVGRDAGKVELIVRGTLQVNGETDDPAQFKSVDGEAGDWAGILFDVAATGTYVGPGYAYGCASFVNNATIEDATSGIAIRQTGAPSLDRVTFSNITNNRHIVLDSTDVYVPYGGAWNLTAPTRVAVTDTSITNIAGLDSTLVNIVVHGQLNTSSNDTTFVMFEPENVPVSVTDGDEWGGIFFDYYSSGSVLWKADVGYAITPISLFYQDAVIDSARIHHFRDRGVWMCESKDEEGPGVRRSHVFRGATGTAELDDALGREGIVIETCRLGSVEDNVIDLLSAQSPDSLGSGIHILNTLTWCSASSQDPDSIKIVGNKINGPGGNLAVDDIGSWTGIYGEYPCAASPHVALVAENTISAWNVAGIDFGQGKDVQVSCNRVENCQRAVEFYRTVVSGAEVRFKGNALRVPAYGQDKDQQVIQTNDALKARFGPSGSTLGLNNIVAIGEDWFIYENDFGVTDTLNARDNYWSRADTVWTNASDIRQYISKKPGAIDAARVDPGSAETDSSDCAPDLQMVRLPTVHSEAALREESPSGAPAAEGLPAVTALRLPGPSPTRGAVEVRFDLAGSERRPVLLEVFDVSGRRVKRLTDAEMAGGAYGLSWRADTDAGDAVGAGVYFVRLKAGSFTQVRKVVVLR